MSDGCENCRRPKAGHHLCPECRALEENRVTLNQPENEDEPEGTGWVTAPLLVSSELYEIVLCRYTGEKPVFEPRANGRIEMTCESRVNALHAPESCLTLFISARALEHGVPHEVLAEEVRGSSNFGDPLHVHPIAVK